MNPDVEHSIIGMIYDAGLDATLWPEVIQKIVEYTESKTAILTALDRLNPNYDFVHTWNIPAVCLDAYQNEQIKLIDMKLHMPLWQQIGVGGVINQDLSHYASSEDPDASLFYEKCLKITGICYIAGVLLEQNEYSWSVLGIHRSPQHMPFSMQELEFFKRIGVHIRRSLQIHKQLSYARRENQNLYRMLDAIKVGIILIDEQRSVRYTNKRAQEMMQRSKVFELDRYGRISTLRVHQQRFEQLIHSAQLDGSLPKHEVGGVMPVYNSEGEQFMLTVTPFSRMNSMADLSQSKHAYVVLSISETGQKYTLAAAFLKEAYGLSTREFEICELFVNGMNLGEIAETLHLTLSSVRTYVKNIYGKMRCNSQAELMHKLMGMTIEFEHID